MNKTYGEINSGECFRDHKGVVWMRFKDGTSINIHWFIIDGCEDCVDKDEIFQIVPRSEFDAEYKEWSGFDFVMPEYEE